MQGKVLYLSTLCFYYFIQDTLVFPRVFLLLRVFLEAIVKVINNCDVWVLDLGNRAPDSTFCRTIFL